MGWILPLRPMLASPALSLALALCAWAQDGLTVDGVRAVDGSELAQVRLEAQPSAPYPGQQVELAVFVELDQDLAEGSLLQLFRRELDLELQLRFPGRKGWQAAEPRSGGLRYALDEEMARMALWGEGEPRRQYRATWRRTFESPGPVVVLGPLLRFAYTTGFRADLLAGSVPTDRIEAYSQAPSILIDVRDFPEEGRPPEFRGDLGRFELESVPVRQDLRLGESFHLAVLVRPLDDDPAPVPPFPRAPDLRLLDTQSRLQGDARMVTWTAEPLHAGAVRLPAVVLASFDPIAGKYVLASTDPTMRDVQPGVGAAAEGGMEGLGSKGTTTNALALVAAIVLVLSIYWWRTRRVARNQGQREPQVVVTQATAHDQVLGALAARLGCTPAAVAHPDLARRLVDAGVDATAAQRAAELFHSLEAERFGGPDASPQAVDLTEVLRELRIPG